MTLDKCDLDVARESMITRWFTGDEDAFNRNQQDWEWMQERIRRYSPDRDPYPETFSGSIVHDVLEARK